MGTNLSDANRPDYVRPEVEAARADLELVADLLAGTRQMWDRSQTAGYIRKWADEAQAVYDIRRKAETLFEGLARVLNAGVGMLFARPPAIEWGGAETVMVPHWENVDAMGTAGQVFVKRFTERSLRDGIGLILVDHPAAPSQADLASRSPDGRTVTDKVAADLGLRPTWAIYERRQVLSWLTEVVNNRVELTQVVLQEAASAPAGTYGVSTVVRYRVLKLLPTIVGRMAVWELWEEQEGAGGQAKSFQLINTGGFRNRHGEPATRLPVAIAYTGRTDAVLTSTIPLMGVAWANLSHWQQSTDLRFYRNLAAFPQAVIVGTLANEVDSQGKPVPAKVRFGPLAVVHLQGEGASFTWAAPPTEAFVPLENGIKEKLEQMGNQGMSFLVSDTRAAETATAKMLDATAENSTLATAGQGVQDAVNLALELHAWYLGIEREQAPTIALNMDFEAVALDPSTMAVYVAAVRDAGLPPRILLEAWQRGGRIGPDEDLEELEAEILANIAAAEEERRQQAEALAAGIGAAA